MALARTLESLGIAYGFMCIEAVNQGLGACLVATFGNEINQFNMEKYRDVKDYFGLPDYMQIITYLILGIPDEVPSARPRKDFDAVVSREKFGRRF